MKAHQGGTLDPQVILNRMSSGKSEVRYRKDRIVFAQGDVADCLFFVQLGQIKVTVISEAGKEAVVGILSPGSFCGEECLSGHDRRISTHTTMTDCVLNRMTKAAVVHALHADPEFSDLLRTYLMERNIRIQEDLVDQLLNSTEKRLARLLLILANHHGKEDQSDPIVPKISQATLAEMIGTSRTHVNFFMNKFRQLGCIEYNGYIKINRTSLNMLLHGNGHRSGRSNGI